MIYFYWNIQELNNYNKRIYHEFKNKSQQGLYQPVIIEYDNNQRYTVKAFKTIKKCFIMRLYREYILFKK